MTISGESGQLVIEFVERTPDGLPCAGDVCCSVDATCMGFAGRDDAVWFSRDAVDRFIDELRKLDATRQGKATLEDYSVGSEYDGVAITLFSIDGVGHLAVRAELSKPHYDLHTLRKKSVSVEFETEEYFGRIVSDFEGLLA